MRSILKTCYRFLPLFIGTICTILLVFAVLPGRLDYYIHMFNDAEGSVMLFFLAGLGGLFIGLVLLCVLAIYEIFQILWRKPNRRQVSGIVSLSILVITNLSLSFDLPARLYFYTHIKQYERGLAQHQLVKGDRKSFYAQTGDLSSGLDKINLQYGFAYLPDRSKTYYQTIHIYGKWYIFKGYNWTGDRNNVQLGD